LGSRVVDVYLNFKLVRHGEGALTIQRYECSAWSGENGGCVVRS
jgi:hypothetical protein